jgi:hypothetical protein
LKNDLNFLAVLKIRFLQMSLCASLLCLIRRTVFSFFFSSVILLRFVPLSHQPWSHKKSSFTENIQQNRNVNLPIRPWSLVPTTASIPPCCRLTARRTNTFELLNSSTKTTRLQLDVDFRPPSTRSFAAEAVPATTQETSSRDLAGKFVEITR